jgi:polyhydroxyalkanoate synthesis regulator phasin
MARNEREDLMARLRQMSEDGLASFFSDALSNDSIRRAFGRAGEALMENKTRFDRNVETLLDFVNIPSKRDVRELKQRLDHLNGQLLNLSMKIDRLMAQGGPHRTARRPSRKRSESEE